MELDPGALSRRDRYWLTVACVVPRPIAWISTVSAAGRPNLAPFSFYGGVTSEPPTLMLSVGRKKGALKDTARNLLATQEGVIHVPTRALAERMVVTSAEVGPEVNELDLAALTALPATKVRAPRVKEAPLAMEVRLVHHQEVGQGPVDLFLLEVVYLHLDAAILDAKGLPDPAKLHAVARLGGNFYCDSHEIFAMNRPDEG